MDCDHSSSPTLSRMDRRAALGGLYSKIMDGIAANPSQFLGLGSVVHNEDFMSLFVPPKKFGGWEKLMFTVKSANREEFRTILVGELAGPDVGTQIGAMGNFYVVKEGEPQRYITDTSTVCNVYILRRPTNATSGIEAMWENQILECNNIWTNVREEYNLPPKTFKGVVNEDPRGDNLMIRVRGVPIYKNVGKPPNGKAELPVTPTAQHTIISASSVETLRAKTKKATPNAANEPSNSPLPSAVVKRSTYVPGAKVLEETTYELNTLPDYGGQYFKHECSVVVQPNILDKDGKALVQPWDIPEKLRPGTLVFMEGSFSVWFIPGGKPVLQFTASAIKILDESDEDYDPRTAVEEDHGKTEAPPKPKRLSAFNDFGSPSKKLKSTGSDHENTNEDTKPGDSEGRASKGANDDVAKGGKKGGKGDKGKGKAVS